MNWVTSIPKNLLRKRSAKFLLIFSLLSLFAAGIVWACADSGEGTFSMFAPETFVAGQYSPFFYDNEYWYYKGSVDVDGINTRFNGQVAKDWDGYFDHRISKPTLNYLLFHTTPGAVDTIAMSLDGQLHFAAPDTVSLAPLKSADDKRRNFFAYLKLAKQCEKFAVGEYRGWYEEPTPRSLAPEPLETSLLSSFNASKEPFIKERLWFQLIRYYFFNEDTTSKSKKHVNKTSKLLSTFTHYKEAFTKNLTYYRALGYVAGDYRSRGDYAMANYLYSRCYDYCMELKIPSKFSFYAQRDSDWTETLKLAQNKEEKITLWHMLGMEYDPVRAIREIMALDPKTDKADLLLSRLVNTRENDDPRNYYISVQAYHDSNDMEEGSRDRDMLKKSAVNEIRLVDSIALKANTAKPYYWSLAAGYLHYMHNDYKQSGRFYRLAKQQLPANDEQAAAQLKMLTIFLDVVQLKHIGPKEEAKLAESLNWLKDLDRNMHLNSFRKADPSWLIAGLYHKQKNYLRELCFSDSLDFYIDSANVQHMIDQWANPKTEFEKVMVRYCPHSLNTLYYHQAMLLTYRENLDKAVAIMSKAVKDNNMVLQADPFTSRVVDCHDCDAAAPQKRTYTVLNFLKTLKGVKSDLNAGKNKYRNAMLLGNAYYNITYYGNVRDFYESEFIGRSYITGEDSRDAYYKIYGSQAHALKYYLLARKYAKTAEQKAKCTFMAAKCEQNTWYDTPSAETANSPDTAARYANKYFGQLKKNYSQTKYYQEILHECGYFRDYIYPKKSNN